MQKKENDYKQKKEERVYRNEGLRAIAQQAPEAGPNMRDFAGCAAVGRREAACAWRARHGRAKAKGRWQGLVAQVWDWLRLS